MSPRRFGISTTYKTRVAPKKPKNPKTFWPKAIITADDF
jgi:hypothetical protein